MDKLLEALGFVVTEENKAKVEAAKKWLGENFVAKHRFDEKSEEAKKATETVAERDKQIESLKKFEGDNVQLQTKIKELQDKNTADAEAHSKNLKDVMLKNAVIREYEGKVHDMNTFLSFVDFTKIELDEKGNVKSGLKEQGETLQKEKAYIFVPADPNAKNKAGFKPVGTEPGGSGGDEHKGAVEFAKSIAAGAKAGQESADKGGSHYFAGNKK